MFGFRIYDQVSGTFLSVALNISRHLVAEADLIIMLVDVLDGLTPADEDVAEVLRRADKPVLVVANKADNEARHQAAYEFYALGLGEVYPLSALHGTSIGELLDLYCVWE